MEVSGQLHASAALPPGKDASTHWMEGWVGPRASLDVIEISLVTGFFYEPTVAKYEPG
jgi:hypothetical protein